MRPLKSLKNSIIEKHPKTEPAPWISNLLLIPEPDTDELRITLDGRNVKKLLSHLTTLYLDRRIFEQNLLVQNVSVKWTLNLYIGKLSCIQIPDI